MNRNIAIIFMICSILITLTVGISEISVAETLTFDRSWGMPGFHLVSQKDSGVEVVYSMGSLQIEPMNIDGEAMQIVAIPGVFLPNDAGAPNLPGLGRYIALPQGAVAQLEVVEIQTQVLHDLNIVPAPPIPREDDNSPLVYVKNPAIYNADDLYPRAPIALSHPLKMRGMDVVILGITPFQYNPVSKELVVYTDVRVRVSFQGGNGHFGEDRYRSRYWEPVLQAHLINYASLPQVDFNQRLLSKDGGYEYLIIVPDDPDFIAWADTIKHWRTLQGISTGVFTLTQTGSSASEIESWINNAYNTWDPVPVAVLLLSDYSNSGKDYGITSPMWNSYCVSDNIYADVDEDDLPNLNIARITAQDAGDLEEMITKFLDYERNPYTDPGFYDHPVVAGGWQTERWFILCSEVIYGFLANVLGKDPVREYAIYSGTPGSLWSTNPNTNMVVDYFGPSGLGYIPATPGHLTDWGGNATRLNNDINSGCFIVQHRDHGGETGWGEPSYHNSDLNGLSNTMLPFVFSINCLTGKYNWSSECFTEKFHRMQHGALGLIAASQVSYSFVNDVFVFGIYDGMWPEFDPEYPLVDSPGSKNLRPGFAQASGKFYLQASSWPYNPDDKEVTYHLFHMHGDAFTTLYSEVPQALSVSHPSVLLIGINSFPVTADDNSVIALTVDGEIIGVVDGTGGTINVPIVPQTTPGTMVVTVTKFNHYRYAQEVEIIPPEGPYVIYDSFEVDDSLGNNNGVVNPGETIAMPLTLKNVGIETAFNISAILSTADPFVTIGDSVRFFGNIDSSGVATSIDPYTFEVALTCPSHHFITFDLTITADGGYEWSSLFTVEVWTQDIAVSEDTLDYGIAYLGFSLADTLIVSNVGNESLTVSDIYSDNSDYTVDITSFILNPWESQEVLVTFTPSTAGQILGTLTVESDDPDEPIVSVFLQGESGEAPDISVTPDSLREDLGTDSISTQMLTIYNTADPGASDLIINISIEFRSLPNWLTVDPTSDTIPAGTSSDISVTFDATGIYGGDYLADIIIASNDPDEDTVIVAAHLHVAGIEGLVGYWSFDECSGYIVHDASGHNNHGTINGASWKSGVSGCALEIVGTNILHNIPSSYDDPITSALTVTAWIKWYGPNTYLRASYIFDGRGYSYPLGFIFGVTPDSTLWFSMRQESGSSIYSISHVPADTYWTHVAVVFDDNSDILRLFINGKLDTTVSTTASYHNSNARLAMGNNMWEDGKYAPLNGVIDEARIYNSALSAEEIESLYCGRSYIPRDPNGDGVIDIGDVVFLLNYLFKKGPAPNPLPAGDADCDCVVDVGDVVYLINHLFKGGPPPCCIPPMMSAVSSLSLPQHLNKSAKTASVGFGRIERAKENFFEIPLEGKFDKEITGLQFDISYDPKEVTLLDPAMTSRTEGLQVFSGAQDGIQRIGLVDLNGQNSVLAGEGPLIMLRGKGTNLSSITIKEAILVDRDANKIPVEIIGVMKDGEGLDANGTSVPKDFSLSQNLPNPFNPETQINYDLPSACRVKLCIYNLLGQKSRTLVDEYQSAGRKTVNWDGKDDRSNGLASGVYFYRIQAGDFMDAKKMIMMK